MPSSAFSALGLGPLLTVVLLPLRIGLARLQRRRCSAKPLATACGSRWHCPTLVFALVLAGFLHQRFELNDVLFGALLGYTILKATLPSILLRAPTDFNPLHRKRRNPAIVGRSSGAKPADAPGLDPRQQFVRERRGSRMQWP